MNTTKNLLISAYRFGTLPLRVMKMRKLVRSGSVPIGIMFYHRVSDVTPNDWTMSSSDFQRQIDWFQQNFDLVSLAECQRRIRSGHNTRPTLAITFDDGYADNCEFALPMLIERKIPVTYFVTTQHPTMGEPFPHDVERGFPLIPNSIEALRALVLAGVEIGGHSRTHTDLGKITDPQQLYDEVITASYELASLIDQPIRYFAFPFGQPSNLNPLVFQMLKQAGFAGVCSAYNGLNAIGGDGFHLQRLHGDPNHQRIKNWLTLDPRLSFQDKYDWQSMLPSKPNGTPQPSEPKSAVEIASMNES